MTTLGLLSLGLLIAIWFIGAVVLLGDSESQGTTPFELALHRTRPWGALLWPLLLVAAMLASLSEGPE